ncbi:Transmembrane protein, partial [Trema orientale]
MDPQVYRAVTSGNLGFFRNNWQNLDNHLKQKSPRGDTILHIAARFGHDQIVQRILRTDRELSFSENSISNLPLHEAASGGHQSTANKILDSALQGHQ